MHRGLPSTWYALPPFWTVYHTLCRMYQGQITSITLLGKSIITNVLLESTPSYRISLPGLKSCLYSHTPLAHHWYHCWTVFDIQWQWFLPLLRNMYSSVQYFPPQLLALPYNLSQTTATERDRSIRKLEWAFGNIMASYKCIVKIPTLFVCTPFTTRRGGAIPSPYFRYQCPPIVIQFSTRNDRFKHGWGQGQCNLGPTFYHSTPITHNNNLPMHSTHWSLHLITHGMG